MVPCFVEQVLSRHACHAWVPKELESVRATLFDLQCSRWEKSQTPMIFWAFLPLRPPVGFFTSSFTVDQSLWGHPRHLVAVRIIIVIGMKHLRDEAVHIPQN